MVAIGMVAVAMVVNLWYLKPSFSQTEHGWQEARENFKTCVCLCVCVRQSVCP